MEQKNTVKIGIMSFAHMHAESYASCLKDMPDVEFAGIADDDSGRARRMGKAYRVKAFASYEDMLASDIDGVIVCSENINHRRHVVLAAQAGKHVLCEKPLATRMEDAEAIIEVCRRSDVKLQTAFPCRYHPAFIRLKDLVSSGGLGKVLAIKATNQGKCPGGWFVDKSLSGGGAVIDHTVHVLDLMRALTGAEPVKVYAEISNRHFDEDFDDTGLITVDFSNGMFATIDASWSRPESFPTWGNVKLYVTGTEGVADMDMFAQKADLYSDRSKRHSYEYWGDDTDSAMISAFVKSIRDDTPVEISGEDGAKAVAVVQAAYESSRTGQPVELT